MNFFLPLLTVLVFTAALLSLALDLASAAGRPKTKQPIPADDLIGRNLRDVR
jgi:hypothetical protein